MRVFITGASSGLGDALARHYAARDATLGLVGRDRARLERLAAELRCESAVYVADVGNDLEIAAAAENFIERFGAPDLVYANAGISVGVDPADPDDLKVLQRTLTTNVLGIAATFQPFIAPMRARGAGHLVGIASVAGIRGLPGSSAYSASKAAAITWLESLRVELHDSGVRVSTICPGYVDTPMTKVNPYRMPFLLSAGEAARRIAAAAEAGRRYAVVPWQMGLVARALGLLPNFLYDRLFARAPRKPRHLPT